MAYFLRNIFLLTIFISSSLLASVQSNNLQNKLNQIATMTANFNQVITDENHVELDRSSGTIVLSRPGKFRWETITPANQLIITDGRLVWISDKDLAQVSIRTLQQNNESSPIAWLLNKNVKIDSEYVVKQNNTNVKPDIESFVLIPKNANKDSVYYTVQFNKNVILNITYRNALGQITTIQFDKVIFNKKINPQLFYYQAPKGFDVIDQTDQKKNV